MERARVKTSERAKKVAAKLGVSRRKVLRKKPIKGKIIYENPKAVPVDPVIRKAGKRQKFDLKNVEWISVDPKHAPAGKYYPGLQYGRVKFAGVSSSKPVAIKTSLIGWRWGPSAAEKIKRLEKTGVPHPKMAVIKKMVFPSGGAALEYEHIVMEPFFTTRHGEKRTKFKFAGDTIQALDLTKGFDKEIFKQAVQHTVKLVKAGFYFSQPMNLTGFRADVFNFIKLKKNGKPKVFVQDIETLQIGENKNRKGLEYNWEASIGVLRRTVTDYKKNSVQNKKIAQQIIDEVAQKEGLA